MFSPFLWRNKYRRTPLPGNRFVQETRLTSESALLSQDIIGATGFCDTAEKLNVQRLIVAVSCVNVSQDPGSLAPACQTGAFHSVI